MQNTFARPSQILPAKFCTRVFSTTTCLRDPSRPIRTTKFVELLRKETHSPIWRLVGALRSPNQRLELFEALQRHGVPVHEFNNWNPILSESDIAGAVNVLHDRGFRVRQAEQTDNAVMSVGLPSWVMLYLVGYKVRTPGQANGPMMDLVYAHLHDASVNIQGPLLVFSMLNLARFNILLPMRRVVETFLNCPLSHPSLNFNLSLQAISCNPTRSLENANAVVTILKAMESRQLRLRSNTYDSLLNDRFVTLQLTKYLRQRMIQEGFVPKASHLEAYLRLFSQHGAIHDAQEYYDAIHALQASLPSDQTCDDHSRKPSYRANTLLLAAQGDRASAFKFLSKLAPQEYHNKGATFLIMPARQHPRIPHKQAIDVFDYTAALSVAARDLSTSADRLIGVFEHARAKLTTAKPTVVTYTVLIRGLLFRKSQKAEKYWQKFMQTGLAIDKEALTVGLQVLTHANKPHEAFELLEKYVARDSPAAPSIYRLYQLIPVTVTTMNDFLVSLNRIARPDVVFQLWDHMGQLYGVFPDSRTLSILLQSARLAYKMDDSFSGTMAHLALKNPFRHPTERPISRDAIVESIIALLGDTKKGPRLYTSGIWNNMTSFESARKVFLQVVFGNSLHNLFDILPPANAIRASVDDNSVPISLAGLPYVGRLAVETPFVPPPNLLTQEGKTHYPHIVVNNANFFNYIVLLGLASRATEIPLTLAWMRALGLQPSSSTLAVALALWGEVSMQAPLIEEWSGGPTRSEYARLVEWLKDWVGEARVPNDRLLWRWQMNVAKIRERR